MNKDFSLELPIIDEKENLIKSFLAGNEFNKEQFYQILNQKNKELDSLQKYDYSDQKIKEINKQITFSIIQIIGSVANGNWESIDIHSLYSFIRFLKDFIE